MKKKVLFTVLAVMLVIVPLSAKSNLAVGLNLGTNMGVGVQYKMKDFDLVGNVGYSLLDFDNPYLAVDAAASYKVYEFAINKAKFDVTVGLGGNLQVPFTKGNDLGVAVMVPVGLKYSLDSQKVPLDFILRVSPGIKVYKGIDFAWGANLAVLWRF